MNIDRSRSLNLSPENTFSLCLLLSLIEDSSLPKKMPLQIYHNLIYDWTGAVFKLSTWKLSDLMDWLRP